MILFLPSLYMLTRQHLERQDLHQWCGETFQSHDGFTEVQVVNEV